jgi:hypothetical protein
MHMGWTWKYRQGCVNQYRPLPADLNVRPCSVASCLKYSFVASERWWTLCRGRWSLFVTNSRRRGKLEGTSLPRGKLDTDIHESYLNIRYVSHSKHTHLSQNQPVSSVQWNNRCVFWDQYKIRNFALFLTAAGDLNSASGNAVMMTRPCRKAATLVMARWVIRSLQPLISQGPSLYWALSTEACHSCSELPSNKTSCSL